jgi:hypothetical protein
MTNEFSGGCLCGAIRFKATSPANPQTCSCDICQKHTGTQSAAWIEFSASNVQWIGEGGKPATYRSSPASSRAFCPRCGSSIGAIDDGPVIALLSGVFDNPNDPVLAPEFHSFEDLTAPRPKGRGLPLHRAEPKPRAAIQDLQALRGLTLPARQL